MQERNVTMAEKCQRLCATNLSISKCWCFEQRANETHIRELMAPSRFGWYIVIISIVEMLYV